MNNIDYWFWDKLIDDKQITNLNNFIDNNFDNFEDSDYSATDSKGNLKKNSEVKVISLYKLNDLILPTLETVYLTAFKEFGYNLFPINNYNTFLLSKYSAINKSKYDYHTDISRSSNFDTKLTFIINLSTQKFEGGEFMIYNNDEYEIPKFINPGSAILFKSYLHHKVTPVTKGERKSLTYFMEGPVFI